MLRTALAAIGLICTTSVAIGAIEQHAISSVAPTYRIEQRDVEAETQLYCLTLAIYFEGASTAEPEIGQRHIARVVHERARANRSKWGGSEICDVVFHLRKGVCQFSFACLPLARRTPRFGAAWAQAREIAASELEGSNELKERSIRYYMNSALTSFRNACRFRKEFVKVVDAGRHEFFREPTREERAALSEQRFEECDRHAEQVRAQQEAERRKRLAALKKKKKAKIARRSGP